MEHEFPHDENGDVLRRMKLNEDDLSSPREIDFSIVFPDENSAITFCKSIISNFDKVRHSEIKTVRPFKWEVTASRYMYPNHREITKLEEFLAVTATPLGGKNDGWGCFDIIT